jgi:signal transduction histidine kinase
VELPAASSSEYESRLRRFGDSLARGAVYRMLLQPGRRIVFPYISAGIARIAGVSAESVMSDAQVLNDSMIREDKDYFHHAIDESAAFLEPLDVVVRHRLTAGDERWFHHCSTPSLMGDETLLWDGLLLDVTTERMLERELQVAKESARIAERARADFLAQLSHRLRNDLAPIPYGLALLEQQPADADLKSQVSNSIIEQVEQIARVLDALDADGVVASAQTTRHPERREGFNQWLAQIFFNA